MYVALFIRICYKSTKCFESYCAQFFLLFFLLKSSNDINYVHHTCSVFTHLYITIMFLVHFASSKFSPLHKTFSNILVYLNIITYSTKISLFQIAKKNRIWKNSKLNSLWRKFSLYFLVHFLKVKKLNSEYKFFLCASGRYLHEIVDSFSLLRTEPALKWRICRKCK